jgi:GTPase SAR1 family protein
MKSNEDKLQKNLDDKYEEAKELAPADLKIILLGDSAVGKSK